MANLGTDYHGAVRSLREMEASRPNDFDPPFYLAFFYSRGKQYEEAIRALHRALEINSESATAWFNLAYCRTEMNRLDEAVPLFFKARDRRNGDYPEAEILAALCCHRLGRVPRAVHLLRQTLQRHPDHPQAEFFLMRALRDLNELEEADGLASSLLDTVPTSGKASRDLVAAFNKYDSNVWDRADNKAQLKTLVERDGEFSFYPDTFVMPDDFDALAASGSGSHWIAKPHALFGGHDVRVFDDPADAPREEGWIVQRYIADPLLVDGRKFDIRMLMLITSMDPPRAFLCREALVRCAPKPYVLDDFDNLSIHATNRARFKDEHEDGEGTMSLTALLDQLDNRESIRTGLETLARGLARAMVGAGLFKDQAPGNLRYAYGPKLLGFDVCLDSNSTPWLLEVERGPGMKGIHDIGAGEGELFRNVVKMTVGDDQPARDGYFVSMV